jgi:4-oxalocrotonate tautomerase
LPVVEISFFEGHSPEERRQLVKTVTEAVARVTGNDPEAVHVILRETKKDQWALGGKLYSERGDQSRGQG